MLHAWESLRQTFPIRKSEWIAAFTICGLSAVLLFNHDLFQESQGYGAMARLAPQWAWQYGTFVVGAARITVLTINGAYWRTPHLRAVTAFISCFVWWQLTTGLMGNGGLGFIAFAGYFILDVLNVRQAAKETGISEGLRSVERQNVRPNP